jgi:hypothetical protein
MAVSLAVLKSRLQSAVAARDGVPDDAQYEQAVQDAVADYSSRNPLKKATTLSIVAGTASYSLPADFLKVIALESLTSQDGVIISPAGLIPVSATYREKYYVAGGQITFVPTPQYSAPRPLWYAAAYTLDDDEYPDMTEDVARVVLLKAQSLALGLQANSQAGSGWAYQIGDERVDKSKMGPGLRDQAKALEDEYLAAVRAQIGAVGMRADYNWLGM